MFVDSNGEYEHAPAHGSVIVPPAVPVTPVTNNGLTYALFVCGKPPVDVADGPERSRGAKFFTANEDEFQVGIFEREKGYEVKPHQHPENKHTVTRTTEFLYFEKGSATVTVFDEGWSKLHTQVMKAGDFLVFFRGGHTLTMLEPTRLVEVKQGPYGGEGTTKIFR